MSNKNSSKDIKKKKKDEPFYKDLTFKEFKDSSKYGMQLNDVAWAGRLFSVAPYWFKKLSFFIVACFIATVLSLMIIWISIALRPPALLLGVYPQGEMMCFPRLITIKGKIIPLHKAYHDLCGSLDKKAGKKWETKAFSEPDPKDAVGDQSSLDKKQTDPSVSSTSEKSKGV